MRYCWVIYTQSNGTSHYTIFFMDNKGNYLTTPHSICRVWPGRVSELYQSVLSTGEAHFALIEYDRIEFRQKKLAIFPIHGVNSYLCILMDIQMFESKLMSRINTSAASISYDDMNQATLSPVIFMNKAGLTEININQDRFKLRVWSPTQKVRNNKYGTMHSACSELLITLFERLFQLPPTIKDLEDYLECVRIAYEFDSIALYEIIGNEYKEVFSSYHCKDPKRKEKAEEFLYKVFPTTKRVDTAIVIDKIRYQTNIMHTENVDFAVVATMSILQHIAWSAEGPMTTIFHLIQLFYLVNISEFSPTRIKARFSQIFGMHNNYAYYQFISDDIDGPYKTLMAYDNIFDSTPERVKIIQDAVNAQHWKKGNIVKSFTKEKHIRIVSNESQEVNEELFIKDAFVEDFSLSLSANKKYDSIKKELDLIYKTLGMHKLINHCTVADDKLAHELGYKENITDLNDLVNPSDKLFLQQACEISSCFRLRTAEGRNVWYSIICNDCDLCEFNGYVFKADISTVVTTLHDNINSPLFNAIGNMFALWTIDVGTGKILYSISLAKDVNNISDLRNLLKKEDQIVFSDIVKNMTEQVQQHRVLRMNITGEYQWYDLTFVMTTASTIMVYAMNVNNETLTKQEIESIQEQVNLALYQTEIAEWIIPGCNPKEGKYILNPCNLDWFDIRQRAKPEGIMKFRDSMIDTIKTGKPFSIEMEINDGTWLTTRGCVLDQEEHYIIGTTYDSTKLMNIKMNLEKEKKKALDASMAKSMFVANMSHEIRAPLQGMFAVLELLNMSNMDQEIFTNVKSVKSSFTHLLDLLNNILDLAKLESNKMMASCAPFNLLKVVEPIVIQSRVQIDDLPVKLQVDIPPEIPIMFNGDPHILTRVIENILSNAVKFTEKGSIIFSVRYSEDVLRIICKDTGIGIIKKKMDVLFDPFEGLKHEGTRQFYGTSIGLHVAGSMIELVGGKITAESQPGVGSTFTAIFPYPGIMERYYSPRLKKIPVQWYIYPTINSIVVDKYVNYYGIERIDKMEDANENLAHIFFPDVPEAWEVGREAMKKFPNAEAVVFTCKNEGQKEKLPDGFIYSPCIFLPMPLTSYVYEDKVRRKQSRIKRTKSKQLTVNAKVLLADDNPTNQIVMSKIFDKIGCQHSCVGTGSQAIDALENNINDQFDIIIMDMRMPDMDGPTATIKIRQSDKPYKNIPIVAITASILKEDEEKCLSAGMNAFLTKPISMNRLITVIQENTGK